MDEISGMMTTKTKMKALNAEKYIPKDYIMCAHFKRNLNWFILFNFYLKL